MYVKLGSVKHEAHESRHSCISQKQGYWPFSSVPQGMIPYCATFIFTRLQAWRHSNCRTPPGRHHLRHYASFHCMHLVIIILCGLFLVCWIVLHSSIVLVLQILCEDSLACNVSIGRPPSHAGPSVATVGIVQALLCIYHLSSCIIIIILVIIIRSCHYLGHWGPLAIIQVGEDGPIHSSHSDHSISASSSQIIIVMRPADGNYTAGAYKHYWSIRCQMDVTKASVSSLACLLALAKHFGAKACHST